MLHSELVRQWFSCSTLNMSSYCLLPPWFLRSHLFYWSSFGRDLSFSPLSQRFHYGFFYFPNNKSEFILTSNWDSSSFFLKIVYTRSNTENVKDSNSCITPQMWWLELCWCEGRSFKSRASDQSPVCHCFPRYISSELDLKWIRQDSDLSYKGCWLYLQCHSTSPDEIIKYAVNTF